MGTVVPTGLREGRVRTGGGVHVGCVAWAADPRLRGAICVNIRRREIVGEEVDSDGLLVQEQEISFPGEGVKILCILQEEMSSNLRGKTAQKESTKYEIRFVTWS